MFLKDFLKLGPSFVLDRDNQAPAVSSCRYILRSYVTYGSEYRDLLNTLRHSHLPVRVTRETVIQKELYSTKATPHRMARPEILLSSVEADQVRTYLY